MRELLDFVGLTEHRHKKAREISGGMQRRLSLAATLVHDPELLFLDEPTAGVDPVLRERIWQRFRDLQGEGRTLFVTTQYVSEAAYCDLVGIMSEGRLLVVDTPDGLRKRAFGGDQVEVRLGEPFGPGEVWELRDLPFVRRVDQISDTDVHLVVDEAPSAAPALMDWARSQGHSIETVEEYHVPFEEVFVSIVQGGARDGVTTRAGGDASGG
jgi:ABC-2 type transport system ATP-binding protein